tara:strand:+ start:248 stop:496 length:249 start_codon:yes stop_codon:yes gene_type:complete
MCLSTTTNEYYGVQSKETKKRRSDYEQALLNHNSFTWAIGEAGKYNLRWEFIASYKRLRREGYSIWASIPKALMEWDLPDDF